MATRRRCAVMALVVALFAAACAGDDAADRQDEDFVDFGTWARPGSLVVLDGDLWVSAEVPDGADYVARVDPGSREVEARIETRSGSEGQLVVAGGLLWTVSDGALDGIDPRTNEVIREFDLDVDAYGGSLIGSAGTEDALWLTNLRWLVGVDPVDGSILHVREAADAEQYGGAAAIDDHLWLADSARQRVLPLEPEAGRGDWVSLEPLDEVLSVQATEEHLVVLGRDWEPNTVRLVSIDPTTGEPTGVSSESLLEVAEDMTVHVEISFAVSGDTAWVARNDEPRVFELDATTLALERTIELDDETHVFGMAAVDGDLWVSDYGEYDLGPEDDDGSQEIRGVDGNGMRRVASLDQ